MWAELVREVIAVLTVLELTVVSADCWAADGLYAQCLEDAATGTVWSICGQRCFEGSTAGQADGSIIRNEQWEQIEAMDM